MKKLIFSLLFAGWYLRNYTVLNDNFSNTPVVNATDDEYISRLSKLPTDIEMPYNQIVRSYIDMYVQRRRELVENMLGMSLYYMPIFEEALDSKGVADWGLRSTLWSTNAATRMLRRRPPLPISSSFTRCTMTGRLP